jgi:hypothetical protein
MKLVTSFSVLYEVPQLLQVSFLFTFIDLLSGSSSMQEFLTELKILERTSSHLGQCFRKLEFLSTTKFTSSDYARKLVTIGKDAYAVL